MADISKLLGQLLGKGCSGRHDTLASLGYQTRRQRAFWQLEN